jgi:hypothetical protein
MTAGSKPGKQKYPNGLKVVVPKDMWDNDTAWDEPAINYGNVGVITDYVNGPANPNRYGVSPEGRGYIRYYFNESEIMPLSEYKAKLPKIRSKNVF